MAEPTPILKRPPGYNVPNQPTPPIRKPQIPPKKYPKPKRRTNCFRCCCCFFCTLLFFLIIFIAVAGSMFYLWFEPQIPNYHLQSLKFSTFKVSVNPDGTFLDAQSNVKFQFTNPNSKIAISYDRTEIQLGLRNGGDNVDIGSAFIPAFTQAKKNVTVLKFSSSVKHMLIDDEIGAKLKKQIQSKQILVTIDVRTKVGLILEGWKIGKLGVRVLCVNMSLNKLDGDETPKCTINIFKWINIH